MLLHDFSLKIDKIINPTRNYFSEYVKTHFENKEVISAGWFVIAFPKHYEMPYVHKPQNTLNSNTPKIMQIIKDFDLRWMLEDLELQGYKTIRTLRIEPIIQHF